MIYTVGIVYQILTVQGRIDVGQVRIRADSYMLRALNPDSLRLNSRGKLGLVATV
jgi:hypothetical protein